MEEWQNSSERKVRLASQILDSRIEAAYVEYAETLMSPESIEVKHLEETLRYLRKWGRQIPEKPVTHSTVREVPAARGSFKW